MGQVLRARVGYPRLGALTAIGAQVDNCPTQSDLPDRQRGRVGVDAVLRDDDRQTLPEIPVGTVRVI
jgi:hypothetical protein